MRLVGFALTAMLFVGCAGHRPYNAHKYKPDMAFSGYSDIDCDGKPDEVFVATSGLSENSIVCSNYKCVQFPGYARSVNFGYDRVVIDSEADGITYHVYYQTCKPKGTRV
ncbi:MAG TPA: hypothetical protein VI968_02930 [archaeon]|nr:hypothetical protein [archaeon]